MIKNIHEPRIRYYATNGNLLRGRQSNLLVDVAIKILLKKLFGIF